MKIIRINKNGSMNELELKIPKNPINILNKNKNSCGNGDLKELYLWKYDNKTIKCYGWFDGDSGFENKHELAPNGLSNFLEEDSSSKLLFGDIFILAYDNENKCKDFCVSDYGMFYEYINEGFDDCESYDSDDSLSTEEFSEDEDYIQSDNTSESDDEYNENNEKYSENELLDFDENIY